MEISESAAVIVNSLIDTARLMSESGQELVPVAFLGMPNGNIGAIELNTGDNIQKDLSAKVISTLAKEMNATFILTIMEAWMVRITQKDYPTGIAVKDHPDRIDCVSIMFENKDGVWGDRIPFEVKENGARTFRAVNLHFTDRTEGRFVGLLNTQTGKLN